MSSFFYMALTFICFILGAAFLRSLRISLSSILRCLSGSSISLMRSFNSLRLRSRSSAARSAKEKKKIVKIWCCAFLQLWVRDKKSWKCYRFHFTRKTISKKVVKIALNNFHLTRKRSWKSRENARFLLHFSRGKNG